MKALIISENNFEDTELLVPFYRLQEENVDVDVAALRKGKIRGKHGIEVEAHLSVDEVRPEQYGLLVLPGGKAPAELRKHAKVLEIAIHFMRTRKPVAAICHGPQILAAAGVLKGRNLTCYPPVRNDVEEAGGHFRDEQVIVDDNLITSRRPEDLPAFAREMIKAIR